MATYLESEIARLKLDIENFQRLIAEREAFLADPPPGTSTLRISAAKNALTVLQNSLATAQGELAKAEAKAANSPDKTPAYQPPPPATASQAAQDDAPKGPNAPEQAEVKEDGRISPPPDTTAPTNADDTTTSDTGGDSGTDDPTRTTEETQSTYYENDSSDGSKVPIEPGASAPDDDAANESTTTKQTDVNAATNALKIQPRPNPLDEFASYTYSISVYLLSSSQYERVLRSKTKKIDGYFLLFQDGGAPVNRGGPKDGMGAATNISAGDSGRNPFFPNDYYIDSLTLDTSPLGKATGASHMTASMKLVVNEPNGITLIDNLYSAVANLQQKDGSGKVNYTAADYLAVIRFYGQGPDGNPIQAKGSGGALIEKFIPFKLASINWSIGSKMVTYEWDCVPQGQLIAGYTARGSVPHDMQITSTTVGKLLGGTVSYTGTDSSTADPGKTTTADPQTTTDEYGQTVAAPAPPNATAAPTSKKTVSQGLMGALTEFQLELTKPQKGQSEPIFNIPDRYFIRFVDGVDFDGKVIPASAIENAKITLPETKVDKKQVASGKNSDTKDLEPLKQAQDNMTRSFSITAGQMITQAIDLAIRNSSYILGQALVRQNSDGYQEQNPDKKNSPMSWFNIIMNAVPRPGGIDPKRNDHAFDIIYTIKPYRLQNFNSKYFPASRFAGVHKSYPYWFTGRNSAIVEYQETMNALYSITVSGSDPKNSAAAIQRQAATSSLRDIAKYNYAVTSGQSTQGSSDTRLNEPAANAADYLFSPGDLANAKIKILGDPDWIQQGSLFKEIKPGENKVADTTGFEDDGSISFETGDVLFEVVWQRPEDYDLDTGLADPYGGGYSGRANKTREPVQSRVYQAVKIISEFRQGSFYQTIEGTLYQFPLPSKKNTVQPSASNVTSDALDEERASNASAVAQGAVGAGAGGGGGLLNSARSAANQLAATGRTGRTGLALQNSIQAGGITAGDALSALRTSGGTAALLGAQQSSSLQPAPIIPSSTTSQTTFDEFGEVIPITRAGAPASATDGTGGQIAVTATQVSAGPSRLPGVAEGQSGLTDEQLARLQNNEPGLYNPTSTIEPSNQEIASDGG